MDINELQKLFLPGIGPILRVPNRLRKGYLKKSLFNFNIKGYSECKQGEKEKARRLKQLNKRKEK